MLRSYQTQFFHFKFENHMFMEDITKFHINFKRSTVVTSLAFFIHFLLKHTASMHLKHYHNVSDWSILHPHIFIHWQTTNFLSICLLINTDCFNAFFNYAVCFTFLYILSTRQCEKNNDTDCQVHFISFFLNAVCFNKFLNYDACIIVFFYIDRLPSWQRRWKQTA